MTDLTQTTALGGDRPRSVRHGGLLLQEKPDVALASLAMRAGASRPSPFGLTLPGPGGWTSDGPIAMFWTGPQQWMVVAEGRTETDFADELSTLCPMCSITEQTDGFVLFEMSSDAGEGLIHALLSKLVNLDPACLRPGSATRTGLEHMSVFVIRRSPAHLAVLGTRSAAASLWRALETAVSRLAVSRS